MSDWQTQVDKLLADYEGITRERYAAGLAAFRAWYRHSYADEPDAVLLTDDEVRDYRVHLTGVKGYKAATVNAYLALIRALVRAQGWTLKVKGVKQVQKPVETLDARGLGRLINAVDGPLWSDKRNVALINVMARAGLRVSEALALKVGDVELGPRSGALLVRTGKGLKERKLALSSEARDALKGYLQARPKVADDLLFLSRTHRGTPASCVHVGLSGALGSGPFDMVVSGINRGANLGRDVFYSGTVGAALIAHLLGIPAIAISLAAGRAGVAHWEATTWARSRACGGLTHPTRPALARNRSS